MPFDDAVLSGLSVGVPGLVRPLEAVHERYGKLPWAALFEPRSSSPKTASRFAAAQRSLREGAAEPLLRRRGPISLTKRQSRPTGALLKNPEYAATLRALAEEGADAFYSGRSRRRSSKPRAPPDRPGRHDAGRPRGLRGQGARTGLRRLSRTQVCGMGPPSSGALTVGATLKLIEPFLKSRARKHELRRPCTSSPRPRSSLCRSQSIHRRPRSHRRSFRPDSMTPTSPSGAADRSGESDGKARGGAAAGT